MMSELREIEIVVNGSARLFAAGVTVAEVVVAVGLGEQAVAVEVNRELVPKRLHGECVLQAGDGIELVTLVGGG